MHEGGESDEAREHSERADEELEEAGGKAAARLREQLQRELGEVPTESPSEPQKRADDDEQQ